MLASRYADVAEEETPTEPLLSEERSPSPVTEKPLPPPPPQRTASEYPKADAIDAEPVLPTVVPAKRSESPTEWQQTQHPRKRVLVKNKTWVIAIPKDESRGQKDGPPFPLTPKVFGDKLKQLEQEGYDTRGFGRWSPGSTSEESDRHGQNKTIYPNPTDMRHEHQAGHFRVCIPDKARWDAYVRHLEEEKLRALGVSFGDDEPVSSNTPAAASMSRQSSQYPPLPFSPPLPTSSAASNSNHQAPGVFSPNFMPGSTNPSSQVGSVASPASSQNMHGSFHLPRQSISYSTADGQFGSPYQFHQAQGMSPINGVWSPQQLLNQQSLARGGSPAAVQTMQNMGSVLSPASPFEGQQAIDLFNQARQTQLQNQLLQQQVQAAQQQQAMSARQSPRLEEVRETEEEHQQTPSVSPQRKPFSPEIVTPIPRGHRHNVSESLQKDIDDAEYHLERQDREEQTDKKVENRGIASADWRLPSKNVFVEANVRAQPAKSSDDALDPGLSDGEKTNPSEDDTNPSLMGTPQKSSFPSHSRTASTSSNPWVDLKKVEVEPSATANHKPKGSLSKLNVEAKEFKFDPTHSFVPGNFSFSTNNFQNKSIKASPTVQVNHATHDSNVSIGSVGSTGSKFNVSAPAFNPSSIGQASRVPSGNFDFSGPSFHADAKPFVPTSTFKQNVPAKIFSYNPSEVIKPTKKSKAIPIVRPDENSNTDGMEHFDAEGRADRPEGHQKRSRQAREDDDDVPQFATPSQPLSETGQASVTRKEPPTLLLEKENIRVITTQSEDKPLLGPKRRSYLEESPDYEGKGWPSFDERPDSALNKSSPVKVISKKSDDSEADMQEPSIHQAHLASVNADLQALPKRVGERPTTLSAQAKPFEFQPITVKPLEPAPVTQVGLGASRFAATPSFVEKKTFPVAAAAAQVDYDQQSFNDIDAVMKQLNRDDSDIGVERDTAVWTPDTRANDQSTGAQSTPQIRSSAPSPSVRQLDETQEKVALPHSLKPLSIEPSADSHLGNAFDSPIHRLNTPGDLPASDWDDFISSGEDEKLRTRGHQITGNVDELVEDIIGRRLAPIEDALATIQKSIALLASSRASAREADRPRSTKAIDSDADDEDDEDPPGFLSRSRSPRKEKKLEYIRSIVADTLAANEGPKVQIAALETMLRESNARAESGVSALRAVEDSAAENARLLKVSQTEQYRLRDLSESYEIKLRSQDEKRNQSHVQTQMRISVLEGAQENLQASVADLTSKNAYLEAANKDFRFNEEKLRVMTERAENENRELKGTIDGLKTRMEESIRIRTGLDSKFDSLQDTMAAAERDLAMERDEMRKRELEFANRHETLSARLEAEARTRERLEKEMERLENQEREAMKARFQTEQIQKSHEHLDGLVRTLRAQHADSEGRAAKFERDLHHTREAGNAELHRSRLVAEAEIDKANQQVNLVRSAFESHVANAKADAQRFRADADAANDKIASLQQQLEEQRKSAENTRDMAMKEQHRKYENHLDSLREQHERVTRNSVEDRQRSEQHFMEQLGLAEAKTTHLEDRVALLDEKLEVARSAATAAAQAVQKAGISPSQSAATLPKTPSLPEKVSPQALRESILVLQEQLQEREQRIESLNSELGAVDTSAPQKLKDMDTEIAWLRELLGVRQSDLEDLVRQLDEDNYDRSAARDAAIRLKANMQMEIQERERTLAGGTRTFPSLGSIAEYTSPRAKAAVLPLAAAWGNWRNKGYESSIGNLADVIIQSSSSSSSPQQQQTPSKPSPAGSAASFLSGLMTPPSSSKFNSVGGGHSNRRTSSASTASNATATASRGSQPSRGKSVRQPASLEPATPPLLSRQLYDGDANPIMPRLGLDDDESISGEGDIERL